MDGWSDEVREELDTIFSQMEELMYEVRNCRRGVHTNAETNEQLAEYIKNLSEDLLYSASYIASLPNDEYEEEL